MADRRSSILFIFVPVLLLASGCPEAQPNKVKNSSTLKVVDPGGWKVVQKGLEFRKISLERAEPYHLISVKMARFETRWVVPVIVRSMQYNLKGADVKTLAEKSGALAMINANYFDDKGRPLGFLKSAANEVNPRVSKSSLYTGIFGIKNRLPFIVHRDNFSPQQADEGLQAGPLLLAKGNALSITRGAGKQSRRSLVGIDRDRRLIIAVADSLFGGLSWVELQEIFANEEWQVQATDLLNLDGGGSTQLYLKGNGIEEHVAGSTGVPVAIGFFLRTP